MQYNIPAPVISSLASSVTGIPTPFSIVSGLFGGGKLHPGKYAWRFQWDGIQINRNGVVTVGKMFRQRLWRAGRKTNEVPKQFGGYAYVIALKLADIIRNMPVNKRVKLIPLFNKLNDKFRDITVSVNLQALRQQGPAIAAFEALKLAPAILLTYGNAVRQMLGIPTMEQFLKSYMIDRLNPWWGYRTKWFTKDYTEWLDDNIHFNRGINQWMSRTGIKTVDLIIPDKQQVENVARQVTEIYKKELNRLPDKGGLEFYTKQVVYGNMTIDDVVRQIRESPEYKSKIKSKQQQMLKLPEYKSYENIWTRWSYAESKPLYIEPQTYIEPQRRFEESYTQKEKMQQSFVLSKEDLIKIGIPVAIVLFALLIKED